MDLIGVPTLYLFDRWDERIGILPTVGSLAHTEELSGEDTVELDCLVAPEKGDRILWRDPEDGRWQEHEVVRTDEAAGASLGFTRLTNARPNPTSANAPAKPA